MNMKITKQHTYKTLAHQKGRLFHRTITLIILLCMTGQLPSSAQYMDGGAVKTSTDQNNLMIPGTMSEGSEGIRVPILMFHEVTSGKPKSSSEISASEFDAVLKHLKISGYQTIHLHELEDHLSGKGVSLPEKPIILTFDDGYASNYSIAYPILKKYDMKASYFVIGWSIGRNTLITPNDVISSIKSKKQRIIGHFSGSQMAEMVASGRIEIENHTFDLHSPAGKSLGYANPVGTGIGMLPGEDLLSYEKRIKEDLERMQQLIRSHVGRRPRYLAYPYGVYQVPGETLARSMGFKATLTTKRGIRLYDTLEDLYEMPRVNISSLQDLKAMELISPKP